MLLDVGSPTWSVMYTNDAFTSATGVHPFCLPGVAVGCAVSRAVLFAINSWVGHVNG
jgi:hypothetical protein